MRNLTLSISLTLVMLSLPYIAQSEIFRHVDKHGTVSYSNDECKDGVRSQSHQSSHAGLPDLCGLDEETRVSIERACDPTVSASEGFSKIRIPSHLSGKERNEAYMEASKKYFASCYSSQLTDIKNSPGMPDLSGLDRKIRDSIKSKCEKETFKGGPVVYWKCIRNYLASLGFEPGESPNVAPTPPARKYVQPAPAPSPKPRIATPKPPQKIDPNKIVNASSGSGFGVSTVGHVITNNHVIKGCKTVKIHTKGKPIPAKVVAYDSKNDIALLKGKFKPSTFFRFSIENAQLLQDIYVAGYPFGRDVSNSVKVTKGIVSALIGIQNNTNQIQIDAALQPGNSGGPIIDTAGNVVGIAVSKLSIARTLKDFGAIPENTNFGVKSSVAKSLLQNNNVNLIAPNINPITTAQLRRLISDSTYYLSCWMTIAQIQKMRSEKVLFNNLD